MTLVLEHCCIPTCLSTIVRGGIEAKCPRILAIDIQTQKPALCLCRCHNQDSGDLNEEQEQWFKERIATSIPGIPFKRSSDVV